MRYELKRNTNGQIEQCDNGDGNGNVWSQRKELNKLAIENLARPTPGKLGGLSNLQYFNFQISNFATGNAKYIEYQYNTGGTFPSNATQTIMFGTDGLNQKALYYNVVSLNVSSGNIFGSGAEFWRAPSTVTFYTLQNNDSSTTSLGTKIPQPAPLYGNGGGTVNFTTDGNVFGNQQVSCDVMSEIGNYYQNNDLKGVRCSGLALSRICLQFNDTVDTSSVKLAVEVGVDISSVSSTY